MSPHPPTSPATTTAADHQLLQFRNCRLLRDSRLTQSVDLWVRDGRIVDPERIFFDERRSADRIIDCGGHICAPGFIDLQINGGYGIDFSNIPAGTATVAEGVRLVGRHILAHGVTAFCPTLVTSPAATYLRVLPQIRKQAGSARQGATVLGTHLEGPFINAEKKGAHPAQFIREFAADEETDEEAAAAAAGRALAETYGEEGLQNVSIVTMAPEKRNALPAIEVMARRGITVALGHSVANLGEGEAGVRHGAGLITHLFNAMLPFHHRDPGLVGLLTSDALPPNRCVYFGIIADGCHTHPAALRIAYRSHPAGLCLVTDAIAALGLPDGVHKLGQMDIEVRCGEAYLRGTDTLCGSITSMVECVRRFRRATACSVEYALEAASLHPARALGVDGRKGSLAFGADADFVLLDDELQVQSTWIAGECVYAASGEILGGK